VVSDNLGGLGENFDDPEELRYQGIGSLNGQGFDLVVTTRGSYASTKPKKNGLQGTMGVINIESCSGRTDLEFCFMKTGTTEKLELPAFQMTFLDIDANEDEETWTGERLTLGGYSSMTVPTEATYSVAHSPTLTTVVAGEVSEGMTNNPSDPNNLTPEQERVSVMFGFERKSCFSISFEVFTRPACSGPTGGGRSFTFFGSSSLDKQCV